MIGAVQVLLAAQLSQPVPAPAPVEQMLCPAPREILLVRCPGRDEITGPAVACRQKKRIDDCAQAQGERK